MNTLLGIIVSLGKNLHWSRESPRGREFFFLVGQTAGHQSLRYSILGNAVHNHGRCRGRQNCLEDATQGIFVVLVLPQILGILLCLDQRQDQQLHSTSESSSMAKYK